MAPNEVCEMRLVMAAALTARVKTVNRFPGSSMKRVHACRPHPGRRAEYDLPVGIESWVLWAHEDRSAVGF
jgi:hypothetical protein